MSTSEKEVIEKLNNVRDKVYGRMLKADTEAEAIKLSSDAQDAAELVRWTIDKIVSPQAAKDTFLFTNDIMSSVVKSTEVLQKTSNSKDAIHKALNATRANADNALSTLNIVLEDEANKEVVDGLMQDFTTHILNVRKNLSKVESQELDALMTSSVQEFVREENIITAETRDNGFAALFDGQTLVDF